MYNAFRSLIKSKSLFIIAILQLSLGLSLLNYTNSLTSSSKEKINILKNLFNIETTYLSASNIILDANNIATPTYAVVNILNELDSLKNTGIIREYSTFFTYPLSAMPDLEKALFDDTYTSKFDNDTYHAPTLVIDEKIFNRLNIKVLKGRTLASTDFLKDYEKENIPIWLGPEYIDKVNIGYIFKQENVQSETKSTRIIKPLTFEVVGFLDYNQIPTIHGRENFIEKFTYSNRAILIPTIPNFIAFNENFALTDFGLFVELTDNIYLPKYQNKFEDISIKYGFSPSITNLKDSIDVTIGNLDRELFQSIFLGFALTFLSIIGIIAIFLGNISNRSSEFGIKLSQGASINILIKELLFEILFTVFFSILISFGILFFKGIPNLFSLNIIVKNFFFLLIITIIILIPVTLTLKRLKIVDLIRRN